MTGHDDRHAGAAQWPLALSILVGLAGVAVGLLAFREADVYLGAIGLACGAAGLVLAGRGRTPARLWLLGLFSSGLAALLGLAALAAFK